MEKETHSTSTSTQTKINEKKTFSSIKCREIDFNELELENKISEGAFFMIYRARWRETYVSVKVLKPEFMREETIKDFLDGCYARESLRHPNLATFMGACTKLPNLALVFEYYSRRSLWSLLLNHDINLTWEDKKRLALEIARGMIYLHAEQTPVLHKDLKSLNIMIDDGFRPKISNFGWDKLKGHLQKCKIGANQWMAPEVIKNQKHTIKSDVFSFGIILWELTTRQPPYKGVRVSIDLVQNDLRATIQANTPAGLRKLMERCWDREPEKRPTFLEIFKELNDISLPNY